MTTTHWHIGCSGFHYKEWKDIFYPPKLPAAKWFEYYCTQFNTLELNNTFYRFPQLRTLQGWYARSPGTFLFAVKVPRLITHYKKLDDTAGLLNDFYGVLAEGLQEKLGTVLFQLPPQIVYSPDMLQRVLAAAQPGFSNTVEFRHSSWWQPGVYRLLAEKQISFCGISHPALPDQVIANTGKVYYRFHGVPQLYKSLYPEAKLEELVTQVMQQKQVKQAHIYFNNTWGSAALANARWLINRVQ